MPAGRSRYHKAGRDGYVFNRPAPTIAALPRATDDLLVAYRIFSPGLNELAQLDVNAKIVYRGMDHGTCGELMGNLGIGSSHELRELCNKSYNVYAAEIKRMAGADKAEAAKLAEKLAARAARKQAQEEARDRLIEEKEKLAQNDHTETGNKRRADAELTPSCPTKRARHDNSNDMIPDLYWLSKDQAQAALDTTNICAKDLEATFIRLHDFYLQTFVTATDSASDEAPAAIPTISTLLARLETQMSQDAIWYVEELQHIMAGASSTELGIATGLEGEWKRNRFHNAVVRGLIERIREFGARLKDTEKEMAEADRLREDFVKECGKEENKGPGGEVMREMFLKGWARQLLRVTNTVAHEAKEYVSFRTMEAEWMDKWADREKEKEMAVVIVIDDNSDSDESYNSVLDESEVSEEE